MESARELLASKGYKVTGLLGHSKSGSGVVVHAARYGKIPKVVICAGRFDHKRGACFAALSGSELGWRSGVA